MIRDAQKSKVYEAEVQFRRLLDDAAKNDVSSIQLHGSTVVLPVERKFGDTAGVQRYVDAVLGLTQVQRAYGRATRPVTVRERKGTAFAHYEYNVIAVPPHQGSKSSWAMREVVVLHELAHHLDGSYSGAHGSGFVAAFLFLIQEVMGFEASFILRSLFDGEVG